MTMIEDLFDTYDQFEDPFEEEASVLEVEHDPTQFTVMLNGIADGARTLADAADMIRAYAELLDSMHEEGFTLSQPLVGGWGYAAL